MKCDLHTHTTASDGSCTPEELVDKAEALGLDFVAVTDHDNVGGVARAVAHAKGKRVKIIAGIELSTTTPKAEVHILGLNIDCNNKNLLAETHRLLCLRKERCHKIIDKLAGMKLVLDKNLFDGECVGRNHIAQAMVERGFVSSINDAFDRYLAKDKSAFVESARLVPIKAVELIKKAGGVAVIAHPLSLYNKGILAPLIAGLRAHGLDGLEAFYPSHKPNETEKIKELARVNGLISTGGSDFHGENSSTQLGCVNFMLDTTARIKLRLGN